jgi:hypothetical protein
MEIRCPGLGDDGGQSGISPSGTRDAQNTELLGRGPPALGRHLRTPSQPAQLTAAGHLMAGLKALPHLRACCVGIPLPCGDRGGKLRAHHSFGSQ